LRRFTRRTVFSGALMALVSLSLTSCGDPGTEQVVITTSLGTIVVAVDSARDAPALDFKGEGTRGGNGYAAFGRVVSGMEVVSKIHQSPAEGQKLAPPVRIESVRRVGEAS
jgi:cyclophilin family peptidyl-prolyl cis-trans isomerase